MVRTSPTFQSAPALGWLSNDATAGNPSLAKAAAMPDSCPSATPSPAAISPNKSARRPIASGVARSASGTLRPRGVSETAAANGER